MPTLIDVDLFRTFLAIVETGSFTRAAAEVHKTQSAVSMQMKKLEERVGRPLFERGARAVRLTPDGHRMLDYAQRIVRLNEETLAAFTEPALQGMATLGVPDDYADRLLPRVLSAFARTHPHVELVVNCHSSEALANSIAKGTLDLAIITSDLGPPEQRVIRREPLHWVSSPEHCTHLADPLPLAVGPPCCSWRGIAMRTLDSARRPYRMAYTSSAAIALTSAVMAGLAVSVLPESAIRPDLRILTERDRFPPLPPCDISLIRAKHASSPIHEALANHIVSRIGNLPGPARLEAAE
jgi:DNA-binding transcriptional LysR family regulator